MSRTIVRTALALASLCPAGLAQAQGGDRYGPASPPAAPLEAAAPVRVLSWPGKSLGAPPAVAQAGYRPDVARVATRARSYPAPAAPAQAYRYAPPAAAPSPGAPVGYARPAAYAPQAGEGWRPVYAAAPALAGAPSRPALPTSLYSPRATAVAAPRSAAPASRVPAEQRYGYDPRENHSVRFYSVHRPFGLQPNPTPIPPQFFTSTADLSQPPAPLPEERTLAGSGGSSRTVRAAPDTSVE